MTNSLTHRRRQQHRATACHDCGDARHIPRSSVPPRSLTPRRNMSRMTRSRRAATALLLTGAAGWLANMPAPAWASSLSDPEPSSTVFSYPSFTGPPGPSLSLAGDASISAPVLQLIGQDQADAAGAAWYANQLDAETPWQTQFTWQLPSSGGSPEGLAFVIQGQSNTATGGAGDNLGFASITHSLAIEIATTRNVALGQPAAPFISVQSRGTLSNSASFAYSLAAAQASSIANGASHTLAVSYQPPSTAGGSGVLRVSLDGSASPLLSVNVDLATELGLTNGQAWMGFTAANEAGTQTEDADIQSWSLAPIGASQLAITSPALSGTASAQATQGPVSVTLEDSAGTPVMAPSGFDIGLGSSSPGGVFASSSGGTPVTTASIPAGETSAAFYYGDTVAGTPTITLSPPGLPSVTQTETIAPAAPSAITLTPANSTILHGDSMLYEVMASDPFGNAIDVTDQSRIEAAGPGGSDTCPDGLCTPTLTGPLQVIAVYDNLRANATLTVDEAPSIQSPDSATFLTAGDNVFYVTTGPEYPYPPSITESGMLPSGVSFTDQGNGTAELSGTPAAGAAGTYPITIWITPSLVETRFSPDALVWVAVVFHGTLA
jgi:hypothetical protein